METDCSIKASEFTPTELSGHGQKPKGRRYGSSYSWKDVLTDLKTDGDLFTNASAAPGQSTDLKNRKAIHFCKPLNQPGMPIVELTNDSALDLLFKHLRTNDTAALDRFLNGRTIPAEISREESSSVTRGAKRPLNAEVDSEDDEENSNAAEEEEEAFLDIDIDVMEA